VAPARLPEPLQKRFGFYQVHRVEPFGEPIVDTGQNLAGLVTPALCAPQPHQAHRRPQLQPARLQFPGNAQGPVEAGFRLVDLGRRGYPKSMGQPQKLRELQRLFLIEAAKSNVLPLDDRRPERFNADLAGRPVLIRGKSQLLFSGMGCLLENVVLNTKKKSYAVTAEVVLPEGDAKGKARLTPGLLLFFHGMW
jgi:hypothetical protein